MDYKILFTCTSYISLDGKYDELDIALSTFFVFFNLENKKNIDFILINEYTSKDIDYLLDKLKKKFPIIKIINKTSNNSGQSNSLNFIIDTLKSSSYKYWIHWEESWFVNMPFLKESIEIMENDNIDLLQFTEDTQRLLPDENKIHKNKYFIVKQLKYEKSMNEWQDSALWYNWPCFSLRPSIHRVKSILKLKDPYFDTSLHKWPGHFEYDYGLKWVNAGNTKALLYKNNDTFYVSRKKDHKRTAQLLK